MIRRLVLILAAAAFAALGAGRAHAVPSPTMHAVVNEDASIDLTFDDGSEVGSQARTPPTIPAGTYTIQYKDNAVTHNFHLIGPGAGQSTSISDVQSGTWTVTLQPGVTYRFQCDDHADFMWGEFQTAGTASGGTSGGTSGGSTSGGTSSGGSSGSSGGTKSTAGTGSTSTAHALTAALTLSGKATLTKKTVKAGRYSVTVNDQNAKSGFTLRSPAGKVTLLTSGPFQGRHTASVTLTAGKWTFYPSSGGPKSTLTVT
jgi:hypothetical protein